MIKGEDKRIKDKNKKKKKKKKKIKMRKKKLKREKKRKRKRRKIENLLKILEKKQENKGKGLNKD